MSTITFWDKVKVNFITNLMNGGKPMFVVNQLDLSYTLKKTEQQIIRHLASLNALRKDEFKPVAAAKYDHLDHWSEEAIKGSCVLCLLSGKKSSTSYQYSKCKVHLHVLCFKKYHVK